MGPQSPAEVMFTDASSAGWGGYVGTHNIADIWHGEQASEHITLKELRAVHLTLDLMASRLAGKAVRVFCDNQAAVGVMRSLYTKSKGLRAVLANLVRLCRA